MTLEDYGWDDAWDDALDEEPGPGEVGRVVRQDRGWVQVTDGDQVLGARTRQDRVGTPVVGDWVVVDDEEIVRVLDRRSELRRADPVGEGVQVLAANIDLVLVVAGLDRPVKEGRVQRALAQAWDADAEPIIVLTKTDLVPDAPAVVAQVAESHPETPVIAVSARRRDGVAELEARIVGRTVVLLGESGAGKSSLLNALADRDLASVGAVRDTDAKGRHTTTRREMHLLPSGGIVIDTPGIRSLGLFADPDAVDAAFPDVTAYRDECRFRDCSHDHEPGCAVRAAVESGALPRDRLDAFLELHVEAEQARDAEVTRARRRNRR